MFLSVTKDPRKSLHNMQCMESDLVEMMKRFYHKALDCSSQPSMVNGLSSSIFPCSIVRPDMVTSSPSPPSPSPPSSALDAPVTLVNPFTSPRSFFTKQNFLRGEGRVQALARVCVCPACACYRRRSQARRRNAGSLRPN